MCYLNCCYSKADTIKRQITSHMHIHHSIGYSVWHFWINKSHISQLCRLKLGIQYLWLTLLFGIIYKIRVYRDGDPIRETWRVTFRIAWDLLATKNSICSLKVLRSCFYDAERVLYAIARFLVHFNWHCRIAVVLAIWVSWFEDYLGPGPWNMTLSPWDLVLLRNSDISDLFARDFPA